MPMQCCPRRGQAPGIAHRAFRHVIALMRAQATLRPVGPCSGTVRHRVWFTAAAPQSWRQRDTNWLDQVADRIRDEASMADVRRMSSTQVGGAARRDAVAVVARAIRWRRARIPAPSASRATRPRVLLRSAQVNPAVAIGPLRERPGEDMRECPDRAQPACSTETS